MANSVGSSGRKISPRRQYPIPPVSHPAVSAALLLRGGQNPLLRRSLRFGKCCSATISGQTTGAPIRTQNAEDM